MPPPPDPPPADRPHRPDLYVVARFLDRLCRPEGEPQPELSKAKLQLAVRLNYDLFRRYLAFLLERGFVEVVANGSGVELVRLTTEGRSAHARLVAWIRSVLGESAL